VPEKRAGSRFFKWYVGRHLNDRATTIVERVVSIADELGVRPVTVALAWVRDRPGVVAPLVGARSVGQLRESLADLVTGFSIPDKDRQALDQASKPHIGYPEVSI
jgi:aryl-alcohol dehydrogenase-like predicted oxidoreductase